MGKALKPNLLGAGLRQGRKLLDVLGRLSGLRISRKLALAFAVVVLGVLVMSGVLSVATLTLLSVERGSAAAGRFVEAVKETQLDMVDQMASARGFILTGDPALADREKAQQAKFDQDLATARELADADPQLLPMLDAMQLAHQGWQTDVADPQIKFAADPATRDKAVAVVKGRLSQLREKDVRGKAEAVFRAVHQFSQRQDADAASAVTVITLTLALGGLFTAALSVAMGLWLGRSIGRPVVALTKTMNTLAAGRNEIAVPLVGRKDELGEMAKAVQAFKDAALAKLALEREAADWQDRAKADGLAREAERDEAIRKQARVVEALAAGLERLSRGDLLQCLDEAFPPAYEKLRADFNAAVGTLRETMRAVTETAEAIRSGTGEISGAADDLSRRTEQQAATLEETAAALGEITATVRKTAEGAAHARAVVGKAKQDAEGSGRVVLDAMKAMGGIETSSRQIGHVIGVIDEIAFQTNLLALNAGVEAARAGDAGRGFAVVASEVRALAQRSAEAAKEIKGLVATAARDVDHGVKLVAETGDALTRIVAEVGEINGIVAEIASTVGEQATGLGQVNGAMDQMDQATQQNAAMVEETTAASYALLQDTEHLSGLIAQFRVGGEPDAAALRLRPPTAQPVAALKTTGRGGAAPKPEAIEGDWREF